ncbi:MAG: type II secretion system F family protein [Candidatus Bathyarchaeia archaeon]
MTGQNTFRKLIEGLSEKVETLKRPSTGKDNPSKSAPANQLEKPSAYAYGLIGQKTGKFMPLFEGLDKNIAKSGLKINFKAYISLILFGSLLIVLPVSIVLPLVMFYVIHMDLFSVLLFGVGGALLTWAASIFGFYFYPSYLADKRKRELEDEMPFMTGYMSILASAGVPPERMFESISALESPLAASFEAKDIVRDVNLFGLDIVSALQKTSARTPSDELKNVLEGVISTIHSGSNLGAFLRTRFKVSMRLKRLSLKKYSDNLSVLSELYVAILLTGPLLLAIMVSIMSVMGGGTIGIFTPETLLNLLTFIGIPVCALIFLIILDSVSPKW